MFMHEYLLQMHDSVLDEVYGVEARCALIGRGLTHAPGRP